MKELEISQKALLKELEELRAKVAQLEEAEAERKRSEETLRREANRYHRILNSNLLGIFFSDLSGIITDANPAFLEMVGYSAQDLADGKISWTKMTPPEYAPLDKLAVKELKKSGTCRPYEKEYLRKDGSRIAILLGATLLDSFGENPGVFAFALDISQNKNVEKEREYLVGQLEAERTHLEEVLRQMPAGVLIAEAPMGKRVIGNTRLNQIWRRILPASNNAEDYSTNFSNYQDFKAYYPDGRLYGREDWPLARSLNTGEVVTEEEMKILRGDTTYGVVRANSAPIYDHEGNIAAAVVTLYDITELKEAQEKLRVLADDNAALYQEAQKAIEAQQELAKVKDQFIAIASHELRTPLTSIRGYTQLLRQNLAIPQKDQAAFEKALDKYQRFTNAILRQSQRMEELINRLLDFSRIQEGRLELNFTKAANLVELVKQVVEQQRVATDNHLLIIDAEEEVIKTSYDEARLEQVLNNLMSNAIKYSPENTRVTVAIQAYPQEVVVSVRDEGEGIPPERQPHIFEKFYRVRTEGNQKVEGLGLGLYISHEIIAQHGGRMWLESQPGSGSTFYFSLKLTS